jgi:hypothetical protein
LKIFFSSDETGWVLAKVDNKKGMVPKNYVGILNILLVL